MHSYCRSYVHTAVELYYTLLWKLTTHLCGASLHTIVEINYTLLWNFITH